MNISFFQNRPYWTAVVSAIVVALITAGLIQSGSAYVLRLVTTFAMYAALAYSWNMIGGIAGYPAFSTAAFFGLGAYVAGVTQTAGASLLTATLLAGGIAGCFAVVLGLLLLHLRGHYFAIATVVVAEVLREIVLNTPNITGGGMGLNLPLLSGSVLDQAGVYLASMAACAFVAFLANLLLKRSQAGFALSCIEQNEAAAATLGVDARKYKVIAFALASALPGAVGAVYASWVNYIDPGDVFEIAYSVKPIIMALLGGAGTLIGPLVGALSFIGVEELVWRNLLHFHSGMLGILIVLLVIWMPNGLVGVVGAWRNRKSKKKEQVVCQPV